MNQIRKHIELGLFFQNVDYTDIKTIEGNIGLSQFIAGMLSYYPWWLVGLYRIREVLVQFLGLVKHEKPQVLPSIKPEELSFVPGEAASFFIVRAGRKDHYWVSETPEDKHLKAFFGVVAENLSGDRNKFYVFTTVKYLHWTGPVYFNMIRPFHHLVVRRMMGAGVRFE